MREAQGSRDVPESAARYAMLCAGALLAHQVGSKAARDALYLGNFPVTTLPLMLMGAAVFSLGMVLLASRVMSTRDPAWLVPRALLASAFLMLLNWALATRLPRPAAGVLYLQVAALGSLLVSGFWSVVNESFDPRSAKRLIGRITMAATFGGLMGGLLAERVATHLPVLWILPFLAALHLYCAWALGHASPPQSRRQTARDAVPTSAAAGLRTLRATPYLRTLFLLDFAATAGTALLDYVFKAYATADIASSAALLRFFALFHTTVSVGTFVLQSIASHVPLQRFGLAARVAAYPLWLSAGSAALLLIPGLAAATLVRGAQMALLNSWFRSGYEALFTPMAPRDKRATKAIVDVGGERTGDACGGLLVRLLLFLPAAVVTPVLLVLAAALALLAYVASRRLRRGYVRQLEQRLLSGVFRVDSLEIDDPLARSMILGSQAHIPVSTLEGATGAASATAAGNLEPSRPDDAVAPRLDELRSADPARVVAALEAGPIDAAFAPHVIPLLAWDAAYPYVARALTRNRDSIEQSLVERLLDASEEFAIRRRIPPILAGSTTRVAVEGLLQGLLDARFEVRFRCGRALARTHAKDPSVRIDRHRVFAVASRETRVDRGVWESQRLLDRLDDSGDEPFVDEYLRERANRSLEHVFTVLSLALDKKHLQIAFQGLYTDDPILRGTALEYLESALPPDLRESLWPFLEGEAREQHSARSRDEILASLMNSHQSIEINLAKLRQKLQEDP